MAIAQLFDETILEKLISSLMRNSTENEYPPEATVGDQWQRGEIGISRKVVDICLLSPTELQQRIAQLAYDFYLRRGKVPGHDLEDWLAAERQVLNRFIGISRGLKEETNGKEIY